VRAPSLALLLILALGAATAAAEPRAAAVTAAAVPVVAAAAPAAGALSAPPSPWQSAARVALALGAVVAAMLASVAGYRWLLRVLRPPARGAGGARRGWFSRLILPSHDGDRVDVLARSWVGAKESVCLIRAGNERFLVGVTTARVSLLGRLDAGALAAVAPPAAGAPAAAAGPAPTFARELAAAAEREAGAPAAAAVVPAEPPGPPPITEESIRAALTQSRRRARTARASRPARVEVHVA
jgi:hypothetical protein